MQGSVDLPTTEGKKSKMALEKWEADHLAKYQEAQWEWPPQFDQAFEDKTSHVSRRVAEVIFYWEKMFKGFLSEGFIDVNLSINWGGGVSIKHLPCLACSSRIWCFGRNSHSDCVHAHEGGGMELVGEEALAMQGYSLQSQERSFTDRKTMQETPLLSAGGCWVKYGRLVVGTRRVGSGRVGSVGVGRIGFGRVASGNSVWRAFLMLLLNCLLGQSKLAKLCFGSLPSFTALQTKSLHASRGGITRS